MIAKFGLLALAGIASALEPHQLMHHARNLPVNRVKRDIEDRDTHPCKVLSKAYKAAGGKLGEALNVDVPPSVAIACLKSVPLAKERNLELIDYLEPFMQFQSTIEVLANPPKEYLFPGVDVFGGLEAIKTKLKKNGYKTQYGFMNDLRSIFAAANDNHFDYPPAILNAIQFVRPDLDFMSLSTDGTRLPEIFMSLDVLRGDKGELDYRPSAVSSIDGTPIKKWLENDAVYNVANFQDPDAQFNGQFSTLQRIAAGSAGTSTYSSFEIPDSYTIKFRNGSSRVVENGIIFFPTADFTDIESGEDFQNAFEIPSDDSNSASKTKFRRSTSTDKFVGFPKPEVKHPMGSIAGYFLEGEDYKDTAVLSILSFLPVGLDEEATAKLNFTEFILDGRKVVTEFFAKAKKEKRDKLIIDMSANGGGSVFLANEVYRLLFPQGKFTIWDRYRANDALEVASEADYDTLVNILITQSTFYPLNPDGEQIMSGKEWFGPYRAGGENVTEAFQDDKSEPWDPSIPAYINGENSKYTVIDKPTFKPENIVVITDGTCASACNIFTGLLTHNHKIRTIALGGRPLRAAMQAMGGVKGTRLSYFGDIRTATNDFYGATKDDKEATKILKAAGDVFPPLVDAPLLPLVVGQAGGRVNSLSGYSEDDLDGYPLHFRYEAANCRLFYTQAMTKSVSEQWRKAYQVAWNDAKCAPGSTSNKDDTISDEPLKYDSRVRSHAEPMPNPGSLSSSY